MYLPLPKLQFAISGFRFILVIFFQQVSAIMQQYSLVPNQKTFGCMAMGCLNHRDGFELLQSMKVISFYLTPWSAEVQNIFNEELESFTAVAFPTTHFWLLTTNKK